MGFTSGCSTAGSTYDRSNARSINERIDVPDSLASCLIASCNSSGSSMVVRTAMLQLSHAVPRTGCPVTEPFCTCFSKGGSHANYPNARSNAPRR